jgi:hypothetical protein
MKLPLVVKQQQQQQQLLLLLLLSLRSESQIARHKKKLLQTNSPTIL